MNIQIKEPATVESGSEIIVPLNRLKKSPRNARTTPHSEAHIGALAASIAVKGLLQNLVVEPEVEDGRPTGFYLVTIGEGRRLAQMLRAKRKEIKKTEPIRCLLDTTNDPHEISLDENVTREAMHPADQFEAFRRLAEERGLGAEDIAARFGVTAHVVRQRLRLGAVSPRLMQVYREGGLSLDQLMAFAITEDHARQEQVYDNLSYNREPWSIRRDLTKTSVAAGDRRAVFVGREAYVEAGGTILRDLFTDDRGGFYEDVPLLDRLVTAKLDEVARQVQEAEGWKWVSVHTDYPHAHGLRRLYPQPVELAAEEEAAYAAAQEALDRLTTEYEAYDELPDDADAQFAAVEAEIDRLDAMRHAYSPSDRARGGVFVVPGHDGTARIERGFIRPEDDAEAEVGGETGETQTVASGEDPDGGDEIERGLSDALLRDLSAHRTLAMRLTLGNQPEIALLALTHALAAQTFYRGREIACLEIRPTSAQLGGHADGIEDTAAAATLHERHASWAARLPTDADALWGFLAVLDQASLTGLLAHCAALTVNVVRLPWERKPGVQETADRLAQASGLDMAEHWCPTVGSYFGRVTKTQIAEAVREAVGEAAADRLSGMKKQAMAASAEELLAGSGWLPHPLRTGVVRQAMQGAETAA
ncbi:ParB/RepB/Spo0J family partition protein [Ancylobacter sp. VNQ12]|uniref:ParB/RepB/Spo0J family partition protein n=1 Tax=Ancylobacter sp. VNQ12 TaxID=3400920 RepID=UPI003C0909D7